MSSLTQTTVANGMAVTDEVVSERGIVSYILRISSPIQEASSIARRDTDYEMQAVAVNSIQYRLILQEPMFDKLLCASYAL